MKRILVVDDDPMMRDTMALFLQDQYEVVGVGEPQKALDYVTQNKVDMILLDIRLPEISGLVTYDLIRRTENGKDVPIIYLTGLSDRQTVTECLKKGASNFIVKPVEKDVLLERIQRYMHNEKLDYRPLLLIVTERTDVLEMKLFLQEEFQIAIVPNVALALDFLENNKPEVIMSDLEFTILNGITFFREARKRASAPGFGAVLMYETLDSDNQIAALGQKAICVPRSSSMEKIKEKIWQAHNGSSFSS